MARYSEIVGAAIALLERGEKPGVSSVAREIGIQPPSLYKHFDSGASLEMAVALEGFERLADYLVAVDLKGSARRRLETLMGRQRSFAQENNALYLHMSTTVFDNDGPAGVSIISRFFELFDPLFEQIGVTPRDRLHAIRAMRAAVHGFITLELSGQFRMTENVDESFARLCRWLIDGVERK